MERKTLFGIVAITLIAIGIAGAVATVMAQTYGNAYEGCGREPWWDSELTEEQRNELKQKLYEIRTQAMEEGWSREQIRSAIQETLAQYGIDWQNHYGPGHRNRAMYCNATQCPCSAPTTENP